MLTKRNKYILTRKRKGGGRTWNHIIELFKKICVFLGFSKTEQSEATHFIETMNIQEKPNNENYSSVNKNVYNRLFKKAVVKQKAFQNQNTLNNVDEKHPFKVAVENDKKFQKRIRTEPFKVGDNSNDL